MRLVFNNIIPVKGFIALCIWPFIFVRYKNASSYNVVMNNHEHIHAEQQKEMLAVGLVQAAILAVAGCGWWSLLALPVFLWWYCIEWLLRMAIYRDSDEAYRRILFEQEAYAHKKELEYLQHRKRFAWLR